MSKIQRYRAADLPQLMDKIFTNSLGLDDYFESFNAMGACLVCASPSPRD